MSPEPKWAGRSEFAVDEAAETRVVVVDDHDLFRRGLRGSLEEQGLRVIGEAADGQEAVRLVVHAMPDVVVMDLQMPKMSGVEVVSELAVKAPAVKVLMLTVSGDEQSVTDAIEAGARGYLLKQATIEEIAAGVRAAAAGEALISPRIAAQLLERMRRRVPGAPARPRLTERELDVLRLVAEGRDNQEIAAALTISPRTAKNHVASILAKLGLDNRIQAAVYAVRKGLV
jgi:DNA-binding NarL/FixJ family response regulator